MPIEVIMPKVDMVMDTGTIGQWHKAEGDTVKAGEPLFDLENDKATMQIESPGSGTLARILAPNGTTVPIATVIGLILAPGEQLEPVPQAALPASVQQPAAATSVSSRLNATPLARTIAREHGIQLAKISGSGAQGRIRKHDILNAIDSIAKASPLPARPVLQPELVSATAHMPAAGHANMVASEQPSAEGQFVPLTGVRKIIAQRLAISATIPQFTLSIEVDLSAVNGLRDSLAYRPSVTAIVARVVAPLLIRHQSLNASFRDTGIWLHNAVHLGIALDSNGELLVPVIRDAHQRTLRELAEALGLLRKKAEAKQLTASELQGSTFSISNLGMFGIDQFTALVNPPEAAILAIGRGVERPVRIDGALVFKPMLTLTLSADHRVTDGAAAARFLQDVRAGIENPLLLL